MNKEPVNMKIVNRSRSNSPANSLDSSLRRRSLSNNKSNKESLYFFYFKIKCLHNFLFASKKNRKNAKKQLEKQRGRSSVH